ncbi:MAG TPA: nucleotidyltransferase domain-containing protein [Steroidobacteraceae bacterium]|jgi:predicted nucleotidyltransferase|nr:nucleotidyltransferase domain-containing protein [Steroidobacteraceae bacterium]
MNKVDLAQLAAVAPASVRFDDKAPRVLRERLMDIAATCELVAQAFEGNTTKTALWFMTSNPNLGNLSPSDLLRRGGHEVLQRQVLEATAQGGPAPAAPPPDAQPLFAAIPPGRALLDARRDEIAHLCQRYAVRSLAVFASALREDFDPDHSDIDLAAQFAASAECSPDRQYADFKAELEQLLKCRVDLVALTALPESRLRRHILLTQTLLYDAAV